MTPKQQQELYKTFMDHDSQLSPNERFQKALKGLLLIDEDFEVCITGSLPKDPRVRFSVCTSSPIVGKKLCDFFGTFKVNGKIWASHLDTSFDDELNEYFHYFVFEN